jgi:hypothetical protein
LWVAASALWAFAAAYRHPFLLLLLQPYLKGYFMDAFAPAHAQPGEFWLARYDYEEHDGRYKVRPVLVLESVPFGTSVAFCGTQKLDTTASRTDVLLNDDEAQALGLMQASRICFGNHRVLSPADLIRKVGELGLPGERLSFKKFRELAQAVQAAGVL